MQTQDGGGGGRGRLKQEWEVTQQWAGSEDRGAGSLLLLEGCGVTLTSWVPRLHRGLWSWVSDPGDWLSWQRGPKKMLISLEAPQGTLAMCPFPKTQLHIWPWHRRDDAGWCSHPRPAPCTHTSLTLYRCPNAQNAVCCLSHCGWEMVFPKVWDSKIHELGSSRNVASSQLAEALHPEAGVYSKTHAESRAALGSPREGCGHRGHAAKFSSTSAPSIVPVITSAEHLIKQKLKVSVSNAKMWHLWALKSCSRWWDAHISRVT